MYFIECILSIFFQLKPSFCCDGSIETTAIQQRRKHTVAKSVLFCFTTDFRLEGNESGDEYDCFPKD